LRQIKKSRGDARDARASVVAAIAKSGSPGYRRRGLGHDPGGLTLDLQNASSANTRSATADRLS